MNSLQLNINGFSRLMCDEIQKMINHMTMTNVNKKN